LKESIQKKRELPPNEATDSDCRDFPGRLKRKKNEKGKKRDSKWIKTPPKPGMETQCCGRRADATWRTCPPWDSQKRRANLLPQGGIKKKNY